MPGWQVQGARHPRAGTVTRLLVAMLFPLAGASNLEDAQHADEKRPTPPATNESVDAWTVGESPVGGLVGSKHDFTQSGARPRGLCLSCHARHPGSSRARLLDKQSATTQPSYPYPAAGVELDSASLLCLGCHDGTIAGAMYLASDTLALTQPGRASRTGVAPVRTHPVGVKYPTANPRFNPLTAVIADGRIKLPDGRVGCTSCHDPHNTQRHSKMLVTPNEDGRLCLSCHRF